ncbi:MAG: hypothetical protein HC800_00010 [Phormidesmis sp. RL_2_1]|nr:hypothetical protein [Phormidesmis sp. RL_2_1]
MAAVEGLSAEEVRQNAHGRQYLKTTVQTTAGLETVYQQIPDIWLVCSRSGANKTNLDLLQDILRLGVCGKLVLQVAEGIDMANSKIDVKPSYDTYVMVAIALAAALYTPELIQSGAPIIHFMVTLQKLGLMLQKTLLALKIRQSPAVPMSRGYLIS